MKIFEWKDKKMKNLKKYMMIVSLLSGLFGTSMVAMAAGDGNVGEHINPNAEIIREDITISEAIKDSTFDIEKTEMNVGVIEPRSTSWNVWGTSIDCPTGAIPVGYSEHIKDGQVLSTWHYTRTYLGEVMKLGDSGRVWGSGTVRAEGSLCIYDSWDSHTHIVKYGTEE